MTWYPVSLDVIQYYNSSNNTAYSGAVLKAYAAGTTTPISFAVDSAGATTVGSVALNASGFPEVGGNVVALYTEENFKMSLYPDQASADSNTGALWTVDNLGNIDNDVGNIPFTLTGGTTARSSSERWSDYMNVKEFGAKGDDSTDDTAAIQEAIDYVGNLSLGKRLLYFPSGFYHFSHLDIGHAYSGLAFRGDSYYNTELQCFEDSDRDAISCQTEQFKMFGITLDSSVATANNISNQKLGLNLDKGVGYAADIDAYIANCRIARFYNGVRVKGRGFIAFDNIFSVCYDCVGLDWYDVGDYIEGSETSQKDATGFRGHIFIGNKFASHANAAVSNVGTNASKLNGLNITGATLDVGRRIFHGDLGKSSRISDIACDQTPDEVLQITGGIDYTISGVNASGDATEGRIGENLIKMSGTHVNGTFDGLALVGCTEHAILDQSTILTNVTFKNIEFRAVCTSGSTYHPIVFGSQNGRITCENITYIDTTNLDAIIGNNYANNDITIRNVKAAGSTTPITEGTITRYNNLIGSPNDIYEEFYDDDDYDNAYARLKKSSGAFCIESLGRISIQCGSGLEQFRPATDNVYQLGTSTARWDTVYAGTGTISTSDEREKQDVRPLIQAEKNAALQIRNNIRLFKFKSSVEKKGNSARMHCGIMAQKVFDIFSSEGLNAFDYGIICYDKWDAEPAAYDKKGVLIKEEILAGDRYGVRYEELLCFVIGAL